MEIQYLNSSGNKRREMKINKFTRILTILFFLIFCCLPLSLAQEKIPPAAQENTAAGLISLNLKDVNIEDALKIISQASGLNVVLDKDVKAKVSITLKDVSWQTALENILKTNELTYRIQENIIRVMSLATVKKEEETLPLTTKIIGLNFAKAEELQKSLTKMLSSRGSIEVNVPTNSLIINDSPEILAKIEEVVSKLDARTPQVMIEALILSVKLTDTYKSGLDYTATGKSRPERKLVQDLAASGTIFDLYYGKTILRGFNLSAQMNFFREDKRVTILASPRVLTLDNLAAQIEITEQVPYTFTATASGGGTVTSTQFKDTGIKLYVTPHITKDEIISLSVKGEQSFVAAYVGSTNEPSIDSRKVETNFMLKDGETVIIGGLKKKDNTTTIDKVPILGDIPFIGKIFFSKIVKEAVDTELIIFITPHIIKESLLTKKEQRNYADAQDELAGLTKGKKKELRNLAITEALNQTSQSTQLQK